MPLVEMNSVSKASPDCAGMRTTEQTAAWALTQDQLPARGRGAGIKGSKLYFCWGGVDG
jgi:hypothetical protein